MSIARSNHISVELVERGDELVDDALLAVTLVVKDRDQTRPAIKLPERTFWRAEPDSWEVVDDDVAD
ncbi:hypothetical protein F4W70_17975 [Pseudomonas cannabina]|nr:hypothetical protein F4W70_17975 [Pseudomonas cannabina]